MKASELVFEVIEPRRDDYRAKLVANKEQLQKPRTRWGIVRKLQEIFPGIKFKLMGGHRNMAQYNRNTNEIMVSNNNKLMTGSNVRNNWDGFVQDMTDLLTHETIHQDQGERRDYHVPEPKDITATKEQKKNFQQRWMELNSLLDDYESVGRKEEAKETRNQINKLVAKGRRIGVRLQTSTRDYLSDRDEITAFAEGFAEDLVRHYSKQGLDKEDIQDRAINELRLLTSRRKTHSGGLNRYLKQFDMDEKPVKEMLKQVVRYIEMKTQ